MEKKKIIATIIGVFLIAGIGIYTVNPSIIKNITKTEKKDLGIRNDLTDKAFGISLKTPEKWKGTDRIGITYMGGELSYNDKSIGTSLIYYTVGKSDKISKLVAIVKADKEDWNDLKNNIKVEDIKFESQSKGEFSKGTLKDNDFIVKEGEEFVYLLIGEKKDVALKNEALKDFYVGMDEIEKNFSVLNNNQSDLKEIQEN